MTFLHRPVASALVTCSRPLSAALIGGFLGLGVTFSFAVETSANNGAALRPALSGAPASTAPLALTKPAWADLTPGQRNALSPLASNWPTITVAQKRKWLALSENFSALPETDQRVMHRRMAEWVALSPQQRAQARLNFAQARDVPAEQRMAHWEAYQALTPEQKQKLVAAGQTQPVGAAPAVRPVAASKLTITPTAAFPNAVAVPGGKPMPRIATQAHQVDRQTLLPQTVQLTVPVPSAEGEIDLGAPATASTSTQ
jgi:Protein of unknown function (DUF3106)